MNSYAFTSLTPVWCEVDVLSFPLFFLLLFLFFVIIFLFFLFAIFYLSLLFKFIYFCFFVFSNTIRPRKIKNEFIGIVLIGKRFARE